MAPGVSKILQGRGTESRKLGAPRVTYLNPLPTHVNQVEPAFKIQAYALILLRGVGHP